MADLNIQIKFVRDLNFEHCLMKLSILKRDHGLRKHFIIKTSRPCIAEAECKEEEYFAICQNIHVSEVLIK